MSDTLHISEGDLHRLHRHFINLTCVDTGPAALKECGGQPKRYNFSGFAVEIDGASYAITAGHVFSDLKRAISAGGVLTDWAIDDSIVSDHGHPVYPIALDFDRDVTHICERGFDHAVFRFDPMACRALSMSAIVPVSEEHWDAEDFFDFPFWLLVGTPLAFATLPVRGQAAKSHVTIHVEQLRERSEGLDETAFNRLYGRLVFESVEGTDKFDIGGMSGGPIFAMRQPPQGEEYEYRLLGIQSAWDGVQNIAFVPAHPFLKAIAQANRRS